MRQQARRLVLVLQQQLATGSRQYQSSGSRLPQSNFPECRGFSQSSGQSQAAWWDATIRISNVQQLKSCPTARWATWRGYLSKRCNSTFAADAAAVDRSAAQAVRVVPSTALSAGLSDSARKQLAWWLGTCSAWVFSLVVLGGVTRLTRSGLSMTDWKFTGERPPMTQADWEAEFAKYQASPEFRLLHSHMTLEDFRFIFWMEYGHRMWGRALGFVFALPAAYFTARGMINSALGKRLGLLFVMGGTQGLVGWWMVRSGLQEPENRHQVPRVSPYRLAGHLTSAFAIYATLVWTTLGLAAPQPLLAQATEAAQKAAGRIRSRALPLATLVGITAVSGAFVAGNDAGRAYNTFPTMNGEWIPEEYWAFPGIRNAFESTAAVQLHHRVLALSSAAGVTGLWLAGRGTPLPTPVKVALHGVAAVTAAQVALGITTLLLYVPVELGSAHQAGAMGLFTAVLLLLHRLRPAVPSATALMVGRLAGPLAVAATTGIAVAVTQQT